MQIAIIASDAKKELMTQFCIAYQGVLSRHQLCSTSTTGKYVSEATGLQIERLLSAQQGGHEQIALRIAYDEIDVLFYFRDVGTEYTETEMRMFNSCDSHNVPYATNLGTAETIVLALDRGDLDWRTLLK